MFGFFNKLRSPLSPSSSEGQVEKTEVKAFVPDSETTTEVSTDTTGMKSMTDTGKKTGLDQCSTDVQCPLINPTDETLNQMLLDLHIDNDEKVSTGTLSGQEKEEFVKEFVDDLLMKVNSSVSDEQEDWGLFSALPEDEKDYAPEQDLMKETFTVNEADIEKMFLVQRLECQIEDLENQVEDLNSHLLFCEEQVEELTKRNRALEEENKLIKRNYKVLNEQLKTQISLVDVTTKLLDSMGRKVQELEEVNQ